MTKPTSSAEPRKGYVSDVELALFTRDDDECMAVFRNAAGAVRPKPVVILPLDEQGQIPEALVEKCAEGVVKVVPLGQNIARFSVRAALQSLVERR